MTDVGYSHPEFVRRWELFLGEAWARGWDLGITSSSRGYDQQKKWYQLDQAGLWPTGPVANPDQVWGMSPFGWYAKGSLHMVQVDGYSHAMDIFFVGAPAEEFHEIALPCGLGFPEPGENWHMQWWTRFGVFPVTLPPPIVEDEDMGKPLYRIRSEDVYAPWLVRWDNGKLSHLAPSENASAIYSELPVFVEEDQASYERLVTESGTTWKPT
jgi:hypothetical protein